MSKKVNNVRISFYQNEILIVQNHHLDSREKGCLLRLCNKLPTDMHKVKSFIDQNPDYGKISGGYFGFVTVSMTQELQTHILETYMFLINCFADQKISKLKNINRFFKDGGFSHAILENIEIKNDQFFKINEKVLT